MLHRFNLTKTVPVHEFKKVYEIEIKKTLVRSFRKQSLPQKLKRVKEERFKISLKSDNIFRFSILGNV